MESAKKPHKAQKSGGKVKKKKQQDKKERHNPKAFTFSGGWRSAQKKTQRAAEISEKREKFQRLPEKISHVNEPPYIVAVQGPAGCGKSTLIRSLIKHYTKQNVGAVNGPMTCVVSKSRRLTFIEVPDDIHSMLDLAKIADLVILMIDAQKGFDMLTFEFVNILQVHGFPRIIGVLTKLDLFKDNKSMKKFKKTMKQRFWTECYDGAKLFYLTGLKGKKYLKREVLNLSRFVSVQKYEPLVWRSQHPYILPLSIEVEPFSAGKDQEGERSISFSGYVRGARMNAAQVLHIPGAGDFSMSSVVTVIDPCPMPARAQTQTKDSGKLLRRLKQQDRNLYAPFCDIDAVEVEGTNLFIKVPKHKMAFTPSKDFEKEKDYELESDHGQLEQSTLAESSDTNSDWTTSDEESEISDVEDVLEPPAVEAEEIGETSAIRKIRELHKAEGALDKQVDESTLKIWGGSSNKADTVVEMISPDAEKRMIARLLKQGDGLSDDEWEGFKAQDLEAEAARGGESVKSDGEDDLQEGECKEERIRRIFGTMPENDASTRTRAYLNHWVYEPEKLDQTARKEWSAWINDGVLLPSNPELFDQDDAEDDLGSPHCADTFDTTKVPVHFLFSSIRSLTGYSDCDTEENDEQDNSNLINQPDLAATFGKTRIRALRAVYFITGGWESGPSAVETEALRLPETSEEYDKQKFELRKIAYAAAKRLNAEANELLTDSVEDIPIGQYVRITIRGLSEKWIGKVLNPQGVRPLIMGGVLAGEKSLTFLNARVKRHRYTTSILKTSEPVTFSVGWRRYQSLPYFAIEERNEVRIRYLKYTPQHMHCLTYFYGHATPPGTGIVAFKHADGRLASYRISMTGIVLENTPNPKIMKKLKFVGEPCEIKQNTAFIRGMFTSDLEVAKVQGVNIQTQSGIRGVIKKARGVTGEFRATFEAKILRSDIVFCKAWYKVPLEPFCNPVQDIEDWERLRTFAEIRRDLGLAPVSYRDSAYGPRQQREIRKTTLKVPVKILSNLPFKSLPKAPAPKSMEEKEIERKLKPTMNDHDKLVARLISRAGQLRRTRLVSQAQRKKEALASKEKEKSRIEKLKSEANHERKKRAYVKMGTNQMRQRKRLRLE